jgi:GT2 family glycosyltransferase
MGKYASMTVTSRVVAVVVSMNDAIWLKSCIRAVADANHPNIALVVVANDCTDSTIDVCKASPIPVKILQTRSRLGFAAANNIALHWAIDQGFDYVMLLNADTVAHPSSIAVLARFLDTRPDYGVVGSLQFEYGDSSWSEWNKWSQDTVRHAQELGEHIVKSGNDVWLEHNYVQGAAMMFRIASIPRVGLLDTVYGSFYEETDLCRRHALAGLKTAIVFGSKVQHFGGGNWKSNCKGRLTRDHLFLRNQFIFYLSGEITAGKRMQRVLELAVRHYQAVRHGREDVTLPWWRYPVVLADVLKCAGFIRQLALRNRMIRLGRILPQHFWSIGRG